ncbi:tenascin-like isoform X2 [Pomacea canaliculata]|uniref:tenascin-like isoform X2 n=1 Tax=Pomacea canaliculata TaxID=400727 RepID=UPI000D7325BA|nr:tenascin-like isoform X2 [Pomacea canaliculata]
MLRFFIFLLSLAPFVLTEGTESCKGTECQPNTWHNVRCSTDDDCDQPNTTCYKRVCRCHPGYFYTTHDTCTDTCSPDDMQDSFTEYPDSALRANLIGSEDGLTVEDCKGRCQTNKTCLTFDFKASGGLCRLHGVTSRHSPSQWSPKTSKGWTHYQRSCNSIFASRDNWHNLLCNSKIDCTDINSDCLSGRCLCRPGFMFNQAKKECVVTSELKKWHNTSCSTDDDCDAHHAECYKRVCRCHPGYFYTTHDTCTDTCRPDDMQDSFTEYPDSALRENLIDRRDGLTVEACKGRCQTNKHCLTFDFKASGGLCRLHNVTAHESPSDWSPKTSKGWTHYQKSCKSTFASHDNWYNLLCNSRVDCHHPHSDCLSGRCLCDSGLYFSQERKECVFARYCVDLVGTGAKSGVYTIWLPYYNGPLRVWCDMDTAGGGWLVIQRHHYYVYNPDEFVDFNRNFEQYEQGFGNISGEFWLGDGLTASSGHPFQTYDRNQYRCVTYSVGAWWYPRDCAGEANLNTPDKIHMFWAYIYQLKFSEMKVKPHSLR